MLLYVYVMSDVISHQAFVSNVNQTVSVANKPFIVKFVNQDTMDRDVTMTVIHVAMGHVPIMSALMDVQMDTFIMKVKTIANHV